MSPDKSKLKIDCHIADALRNGKFHSHKVTGLMLKFIKLVVK